MRAQRVVPLRKAPLHPLQQVGPIGVVVAGHVFFVDALPRGLPGPVEQPVECLARGDELGILGAVDVAAAGIVQVREIELVDLLIAHQLQQRGQVVRVQRRHREAQADLDAACAQQPHRRKAAVERAVQAPELVVRRGQAIEADADVVEARGGHAVGHRAVDQRAVGGQADIETLRLRARGDLEQIGPQQRLTAGENQHRNLEGFQIVHRVTDLGVRQLARVVVIGRKRIAVLARQVAAPDQVPDHDRSWRRGAPRRCHRARAFGGGN